MCAQLAARKDVTDRTKLGEVLVRTARRLGSILPQYKLHFINALMGGVADSDELVRATCLSGLGEVCKELRYSVGPVLQDIMVTVSGVLQCDPCLGPRRAAVLLVTLLLRGLGTGMFKVGYK